MRNTILAMMMIGLLAFAGELPAENVIIYGHISFFQEGVQVIRGDGTQVEKVMVNLPVAAGDRVITSEKSRCEIQGDNGTIMRLDQDSELVFETVLAQSLTSRWKITTARLMKGNLYTINNVYDQEMLQVLTTNAALKLNANSKSLVYFEENGDTRMKVLSGRVHVLFGGDGTRSPDSEKLTRGEEARITAQGQMLFEAVNDVDFRFWNDGMNKNFEETHEGISKLPKPIYRYPKAVVNWAEKWSGRYGEWVYDDFFGYVWHPYHEHFANRQYSPFFNGEFVTISGQTYMVPQEAWGWVPMYLGVWHWSDNHGWIWIPGNAFHYDWYDVRFARPYFGWWNLWDLYGYVWCMDPFYPFSSYCVGWNYYGFNSSNFYWDYYYYWNRHSPHGKPSNSKAPFLTPDMLKDNHGIPPEISKIVRRIHDLSPVERERVLGEYVAMNRPVPSNLKDTVRSEKETRAVSLKETAIAGKSFGGMVLKRTTQAKLDWNPDHQWARTSGLRVSLNRKTNEYFCPNLGITASQLGSDSARRSLRDSAREIGSRGGERGFSGGSHSGSGGSAAGAAHSSSSGSHSSSVASSVSKKD